MTSNPDLFRKALIYAAEHHGDQLVKDREYTYLVHVVDVAMGIMDVIYREENLNIDLAVQCALLHDVIEDTDATYEDVVEKFGKDVADGVLALSKDKKLEKGKQLPDSIQRIKKMPREIWMVKLSDRISNLQKPPSSWTREKIKSYQDDAKYIYESLYPANQKLADRLGSKIAEYSKHLA